MKSSDLLLAARDVTKDYFPGPRAVRVLRGVNCDVRAGETVAVRGASGAGKTTLLQVLGGLDRPTAGCVAWRGQDLYRWPAGRRSRWRAQTVGFVFQSYHLLPELDVLENVLLPASALQRGWGLPATVRARGRSILERVGLADRLDHRPTELSGGEQQRVALARALLNQPEIILADEPTGNLDSVTGDQVLDLLFSLVREQGVTLVLVSHDEAVVGRCDRVVQLVDGCL
ncbi:MAG: ABC transporter ATP-binding protein [Candidatus Marinimicrobia bacterium]|nr:ABC transporter ATP-binding protein [Candidatus Neomarinimicrobiota bacterium]